MMEMPPRTCPGLHLTVQWCEELIDQLKRVPTDTYDGIISSGRNGAYLKGYLDGTRSASLPEWALVNSISRERIKVGEWAKQSQRRLRDRSTEIGESICELLAKRNPANPFQRWMEQVFFSGRRPGCANLRFLFVDDSVSPSPNGTLAFVRAAVAAWGCQLTGWVATDHLLPYRMGGFHPIRHFEPLLLIELGQAFEARRMLENRESLDPWEDALLQRIIEDYC